MIFFPSQVWIAPSTGVATAFLEQLEKISSDSTALMLAIFAVFALVHSGLAYLRPYGRLPYQASAFNISSFCLLFLLTVPVGMLHSHALSLLCNLAAS